MTTAATVETLFDSGPFPHFQKSLGLLTPVGFNVSSRATVTVLIGWLPLVVLVLAEHLRGQVSFFSFLTDYGVHARSLIAAPLLIMSEPICLRRLENIAVYFVRSGIVQEQDRRFFAELAMSTRSLMSSTFAEVVAIVLAYAIGLLLIRYAHLIALPPWYVVGGSESKISWAAWWYALVSMPLLLILFFGWLWRVILWGRFLIRVAKLKLCLISAHPDLTAGLKFLNSSLFAFMPVAFTFGVVVAGSAANRVAYQGATVDAFQNTVGGLLVFVLVLFVGPLLVFAMKLHRQKVQGIFTYGALADDVGRQFENKWIANYDKYAGVALESSDFSATTDLYQVVSNVHEMHVLPFDVKGLLSLMVSALLPFIPVVLMMVPIRQIIKEAARLLV